MRAGSCDLSEALGSARALDARHDVVAGHRFPTHLLRQGVTAVDALTELHVGALADVHELHVRRHALAAELTLPPELVDEHDLDVARAGVELLYAGVISRLAAGKVGQALAVGDGPLVPLLHAADL